MQIHEQLHQKQEGEQEQEMEQRIRETEVQKPYQAIMIQEKKLLKNEE